MPNGYIFSEFEQIILTLNFTSGAYSDYTQYKLTDLAQSNHKETKHWTKNDSLWVEYEYYDLDYYILFEDYDLMGEDSYFEYISYFRNENYIRYDALYDNYSIVKGSEQYCFSNCTEVPDLSDILVMKYYSLEEEKYGFIAQYTDYNKDGEFDQFQYGETTVNGEIAFHTNLIFSENEEHIAERKDEKLETARYKLSASECITHAIWRFFADTHEIYATRSISSETDIEYTSRKGTQLIQKDLDLNGQIDREVIMDNYYQRNDHTIYSKRTTKVEWEPLPIAKIDGWQYHSGQLKDYETTETSVYDGTHTFLFSDYEGEEPVSTRYYADTFPNSLADKNEMGNFMQVVINDYNDYDEDNDVIVSVPLLEELLGQTHDRDKVSAEYDYSLIIEDGIINSSNILEDTIKVDLPGTYSNGLSPKLNVIKVSPSEGAYYQNQMGDLPERLERGSAYYFLDSEADGSHETVLIAGKDGKIESVGFDYTADGIFQPQAKVASRIDRSKAKHSHYDKEYDPMDLIANDLIFHYDKAMEGMVLQDTFSDSLFDLWKLEFQGGESELAREVKEITADKFLKSLTIQQIGGDVARQIEAQLAGIALGALLAPVGLSKVGYFVGYGLTSIAQQFMGIDKMKAFMASQNFYPDADQETLTDSWFWDDFSSEAMTTALFGSYSAVTVPFRKVHEGTEYTGEIILAPYGPIKTHFGTGQLLEPDLDYALQTRPFHGIALNDIPSDDPIVREANMPPEVRYKKNSLGYIQLQLQEQTEADETQLTHLIPYMFNSIPIFDAVNGLTFEGAPDFYVSDPIYTDSIPSDEEKYYTLTKVYDGDHTLQLIKDKYRFEYEFEVENIECSLNAMLYTDSGPQWARHDIGVLDDDEFHISNGILYIDTDRLDDLIEQKLEEGYDDAEIILDLSVPKYTEADSSDDTYTQNAAAMQAIHGSLLEYYYQFNLAAQAQENLNALAYTMAITFISTIATMGISTVIGKAAGKLGAKVSRKRAGKMLRYLTDFGDATAMTIAGAVMNEMCEESLRDPFIESFMSNIAEYAGGNEYHQAIATTVGETGRETMSGIFQTDTGFYAYSKNRMEAHQGESALSFSELRQEYRENVLNSKNQKISNTWTKIKMAALLISLISGQVGLISFGTSIAVSITSLLAIRGVEGISLKLKVRDDSGSDLNDNEIIETKIFLKNSIVSENWDILSEKYWKILTEIKEKYYPRISFGEFWRKSGLAEKYSGNPFQIIEKVFNERDLKPGIEVLKIIQNYIIKDQSLSLDTEILITRKIDDWSSLYERITEKYFNYLKEIRHKREIAIREARESIEQELKSKREALIGDAIKIDDLFKVINDGREKKWISIDLSKFLKLAYQEIKKESNDELETEDILIEMGFDVNDLILSHKRKLDNFMFLLKILHNSNNYENLNEIYEEFIRKAEIGKKTASLYLSNIIDNINEYQDIREEMGYSYYKYVHLRTEMECADYLRNVIVNDEEFIRKIKRNTGIELEDGYAPFYSWLNDYGYTGYLQHIFYKFEASYSEIVEMSGLDPIKNEKTNDLGRFSHWIYEYYTLRHLRELMDSHTFFEAKLKDSARRSDITAIIENKLKDFLFDKKFNDRSLRITDDMKSTLKQIRIDFYQGKDLNVIKSKCKKGYQGEHTMLVIVLMGTKTRFNMNKLKGEGIPELQNVKVLNLEQFREFIGLDNSFGEKIENTAKKFGKALFNPLIYKELEGSAAFCEIELKENLPDDDPNESDYSYDGWIKYVESRIELRCLLEDSQVPPIQLDLLGKKILKSDD